MGNAEYKRFRAKKHNMLRAENEAYAEDRRRFPKKAAQRNSNKRAGLSVGLIAGLAALPLTVK